MVISVQVTLTSAESKVLLAKAAVQMPQVCKALTDARVLLIGGTTVSALSEELGFCPLRISGRINASGCRTALNIMESPHNLLIENGQGQNADKNIQDIVMSLGKQDLIIVGANAMDTQGRAAVAFAAAGGGSRGFALHSGFLQGVPFIILCGINKLVLDLASAMANYGRRTVKYSMGAAIGLYPLYGPIITEIKAFEFLFGVDAVVIAADGIDGGEGSRTFILKGEEEVVEKAWKLVMSIKGAQISCDKGSLPACTGACAHCQRHIGCIYKTENLREPLEKQA